MIRVVSAFVLGAFCLQQQPVLPSLFWAIIPFICLFLLALLFRISRPFARLLKTIVILSISLLFGFFWAAMMAQLRVSDALPPALQNIPIVMVGVVASPVELMDRGERFRFDVEQVLSEVGQIKNVGVPQHISLSYYPARNGDNLEAPNSTQATKFKVGERWRITAKLKRPHGTQNPHGFDFEAWALAENIRATGTIRTKADNKMLQAFVWRPKYIIEHLRDLIKQRIAAVLKDKPYAGVIQALVMGDDAGIAANDWQLFLSTGTTHLMSISGLHITMLSGLAFTLAGLFWRRHPALVMRCPTRKAATLAGLVVALLYAMLAGFAVPAQRTCYMLLVFALALWSGRKILISQVLALGLLVVVILDPWAVIAAGFWLSFSAVAVLAYVFAGRIALTAWLKAALQSQWAVTLGMLPLLLFMFHQASLISPLANAFAIPLISFLVTPLALLGSFLPIDALLKLSYLALEVCMYLLNWLNQMPSVIWQQHAPPLWTLFLGILGMLWLLLPAGFPLRSLGLLGFMPMLFALPAQPEQGDMKVAILDVGQGLSVVVQTAKHTLLYDAGPKYSTQSDAAKRVVLPFLNGEGIAKLDAFVVSHDDTDHAGGKDTILTQMPVDRVISSLPLGQLLPNYSIRHVRCLAQQGWTWDGVKFEMLYPALRHYENQAISDNNRSCVLKVTSASGSVLLTGDIEKSAEQTLLASQIGYPNLNSLQTDVMIAPHHGSKTSSSSAFVSITSPKLTVFTAGYLNRFRHPRPEVMLRYQAAGSQILRSDYDGAILLAFKAGDKSPYHMNRWRKQYQRYWHDNYP
jgi:competence protein ComEC